VEQDDTIRTRERITAIQALRGIAALAVAIGHARIAAYWLARRYGEGGPPPGQFGGWGVDLFFVISGFVMVHASAEWFARPGARGVFVKRRLIRIVPLYWLATCVFAAWRLKFGPPFGHGLLLASLVFLPWSPTGSLDHVVPVLDQGWTLAFEMLFYLLFAIAIGWRAGRAVAIQSVMLGAAVVIGALATPTNAALFSWTRPILIEFVAGMGLALAYRRGMILPLWARLMLAAAGVAGLACAPDAFPHWQDAHRLLWWGIPAALLMAAAVSGPIRLPWQRLWERLGDASYALYLWHLPLFAVAGFVVRRAHVPFAQWPFIVIVVLLAQGVGLFSFRWLERPLTTALNRRFVPARHRDDGLEESGA